MLTTEKSFGIEDAASAFVELVPLELVEAPAVSFKYPLVSKRRWTSNLDIKIIPWLSLKTKHDPPLCLLKWKLVHRDLCSSENIGAHMKKEVSAGYTLKVRVESEVYMICYGYIANYSYS